MNLPFRIVDTFADGRFAGNPAAVAVCASFPDEREMQAVAHRIGLPTTAFVVPLEPAAYRVRWFTPHAEINLCGHATIASARALFGLEENAGADRLRFVSDNGELFTTRRGDLIAIDLPAAPPTACEPPPGLLAALGTDAVGCAVSHDDVLVELESRQAVAAVRPDFEALARLPFRGHVVTARADSPDADFVSRTFFPIYGVNEDQVCVSAHCKLTPFWARRLGRSRLRALQLSDSGGRLEVEDFGDRVLVLGTAVLRDAPRPAATVAAAARSISDALPALSFRPESKELRP